MTGLELSKNYFLKYGKPMIDEQFPEEKKFLAFGLTGSGSECLGFDDEFSQDHDFEPGFCIFIPDENLISRKTAFRLERAYASLPKEFEGFKKAPLSPVGGNRLGVLLISDFFTNKIGCADGKPNSYQWLTIPDFSLAEATNGEIFEDNYGLMTQIRSYLSLMPEDIRKKRLAGSILTMAQSGQYNYTRCLKHGETAAAQLAVNEFVKSTIKTVFLLNKQYMPYYKWTFRAMRTLPKLSILAETMEYLLTTNNDEEIREDKYFMIEDAASSVIDELINQNITHATCGDLEKHAYSVNDTISDAEIRNLNILYTE